MPEKENDFSGKTDSVFKSEENIKKALTVGEGELADYLTLVSCYETGDWEKVATLAAKTGLNEEKTPEFYMDAVAWADSIPI